MEAGTTWGTGCRGCLHGKEWRLVLPGGLAAEAVCMVRNGGWYYLGGWLQRRVVLHGKEWRLVLPGGLAAETGSSAVVRKGTRECQG